MHGLRKKQGLQLIREMHQKQFVDVLINKKYVWDLECSRFVSLFFKKKYLKINFYFKNKTLINVI